MMSMSNRSMSNKQKLQKVDQQGFYTKTHYLLSLAEKTDCGAH